jgi:hypothetical protein
MEHTLETIANEQEDQSVEVTPPCTPAGDPQQDKLQ